MLYNKISAEPVVSSLFSKHSKLTEGQKLVLSSTEFSLPSNT